MYMYCVANNMLREREREGGREGGGERDVRGREKDSAKFDTKIAC